MLRIERLNVFYGLVHVVWDVALEVGDGEIVALVGANGAGKTSTMLAIAGVLRGCSGGVTLDGAELGPLPAEQRVAAGLVLVPEGRQLFPDMTVRENLELGAFARRARAGTEQRLDQVWELLPVLRERQRQRAGSLSGGEQQMLAIGRGLMSEPRVLMLDEPTLGLAPMYAQRVLELVQSIRALGTAVLFVEQNVKAALRLADRGYVLESGRVAMAGSGEQLLADPGLKRAYLGI